MSVDSKHENYTEYNEQWIFIRDAISGDRAIKAKKEAYVPKLGGQDKDEYQAYLKRPSWDGFTQRVIDVKTGMMFAKTPTQNAPKQLEDLFDNIDLKGATLTDFTQEAASEVDSVGRIGGLVDMGKSEGQNRPYFSIYKTESIINWKYENINNQHTLTMVVLQEEEKKWIDEFDSESETIYRVLLIKKGRYEQHIYRPNKNEGGKTNGYTIEEIIPQMNGNPLTFIPFVCATPEKLTLEPTKPPLLDLADKNLTLFKLDVEYYNALHWVGSPTPYAFGVQPKEIQGFKVGGAVITGFQNHQGKLGMLQISAEGLQDLRDEKQSVTDTIVALGSNTLQSDKKVAEAENTVAMRSAGQNAIQVSTADTLSRFITKLGDIAIEWMGTSGEFTYQLNKDYNLTQISPQLLKEVITGKTLGEVPRSIVYETMKQGEIPMGEIKTLEDYETALAEEAPIVSTSALQGPVNNTIIEIDDFDYKKFAEDVGV